MFTFGVKEIVALTFTISLGLFFIYSLMRNLFLSYILRPRYDKRLDFYNGEEVIYQQVSSTAVLGSFTSFFNTLILTNKNLYGMHFAFFTTKWILPIKTINKIDYYPMKSSLGVIYGEVPFMALFYANDKIRKICFSKLREVQLFIKRIKSLNSKIKINGKYNKEDYKAYPFLLMIGILFFFPPFSIFSILCGIISLYQIKKNPNRFRGRKMAIFEIIIGAVLTILTAILYGYLISKSLG